MGAFLLLGLLTRTSCVVGAYLLFMFFLAISMYTFMGQFLVIATPNRDSLQVIGRRIRDLFRGRRRPPRDYFVSTSHLREYSWRELEALLPPAVQLRRRAVVGWNGGWKRRVASLIAAAPGLHRLAQMVVVEVEKAQTPGSVPS